MQGSEPTVELIVYRITGRQGIIDIPHRYCEECDLTIAAVRRVVDDRDDPRVRIRVLPWMLHFWRPIWRGGWHAPIVTVNGRVISQGVVPIAETIRNGIDRVLASEHQDQPDTRIQRPS